MKSTKEKQLAIIDAVVTVVLIGLVAGLLALSLHLLIPDLADRIQQQQQQK
jgi:hypothetical protein